MRSLCLRCEQQFKSICLFTLGNFLRATWRILLTLLLVLQLVGGNLEGNTVKGQYDAI